MREHLRGNLVAYLALFVALGGTGAYAASKIDSGDIKDNSIKGKDIRTGQVAGSDLRDDSATGADVANGSLDGSDVKDGGLTGADIADKSVGGGKIDPATKVPNADMLDGHGSTRYGVGLQMGRADLLSNGGNVRFPIGITASDTGLLAVSPETLELRDFTAVATGLEENNDSITIELEGEDPNSASFCQLTTDTGNGAPECHLQSSSQFEIPAQKQWGIRFTGANLDGDESVTFSYRSVR
jgi:hypothetical protein